MVIGTTGSQRMVKGRVRLDFRSEVLVDVCASPPLQRAILLPSGTPLRFI